MLLDEAYIHISEEHMCSDLVAKDKDVVILRTFSKIYGMAGIRAGAALGRPGPVAEGRTILDRAHCRSRRWSAATASLKSKTVVPVRRKLIKDVREDVFAFMDKHKFGYVRSVSNKFMVDVHRPGNQNRTAMEAEKVYIGRVWPSWPTHVRVTIGTQDEMNKFKAAFLKVMA